MNLNALIVDEDVSLVTMLKRYLKQAGFTVIVASDGQSALSILRSGSVDVIIMDIKVPKLSGLEFCKKLRQGKVFTPIFLLSSEEDHINKVLSLEIGADAFLTKPISPRELVARVRAVLRRTAQPKTFRGRAILESWKLGHYICILIDMKCI